jgi:hypothetical protein
MGLVQVPYGHSMVSRIAPAMGPEAYKTYSMNAPLRSHWRPGTCEEFECDAYLYGWVSTFDLSTELGQQQYWYCKADKERGFSMQRVGTSVVKLTYKPGNRCFRSADHRVPVGRPPRYLVAGGDFRGNPRNIRVVHRNADEWVEDFSIHQDKLATALERG